MTGRNMMAALAVGAFVLTACGSSSSRHTAASPATTAAPAAPAGDAGGWPTVGRYGCSQSVQRLVNGSFETEIQPQGFVTLRPGGRYTDPNNAAGSFSTSGGLVHFTGGKLDRATAEPINAEPNRMFIRIPTSSGDMRWACTLT